MSFSTPMRILSPPPAAGAAPDVGLAVGAVPVAVLAAGAEVVPLGASCFLHENAAKMPTDARTSRGMDRSIVMVSSALDTEICAQLLAVRGERRVRHHVDHPPMLDDTVPVRDRFRELQVRFDEDDGESVRFQALNGRADLLDDDRREPLVGLVEEEETRAGAQDPRDR